VISISQLVPQLRVADVERAQSRQVKEGLVVRIKPMRTSEVEAALNLYSIIFLSAGRGESSAEQRKKYAGIRRDKYFGFAEVVLTMSCL
jgi:hypothetical protein